MYIYSGKCRQGICGEVTPMTDSLKKKLHVGDIVMVSTIDENGICDNTGLTVVVSDRFESFSDGTHKEKSEGVQYFVMGIKDVDFIGKDSERWFVKKVKDVSDVVSGEHWEDYGFRYSEY